MKSLISQCGPDVALRAKHRRKHRPSAASIIGDVRELAAPCCKSLRLSFFSHSLSTATLLKANVLFEPVLYFKGRYLSPILVEVGEEWLGMWRTMCRNSHFQKVSGPSLCRVLYKSTPILSIIQTFF